MKEESSAHLESIRRGIWAILGVLLLIFGFDHTPVGRSELGAVIAILGLATGILMITYAIGAMAFRFLIKLKEMADDDKNA
jgi:hypothetical protein